MTHVERRDTALLASSELKPALAAALADARSRTLALLEPVSDDALVRQHSSIMSPLVWDLAHVGFFEELWLLRRVGGEPPLLARDDLYDAFRHSRADRASLRLLTPREARDYLARVRERSLAVLERVELDPDEPLLRDGFVFAMLVQHEHQHVETMLATLNLREDGAYPLAEPAPPAPDTRLRGEVLVDGGTVVLGTDEHAWIYDNERPPHEVELRPFLIDAAPVANGEYLLFVEAGGYDDPRWWTEPGWAWRHHERAEHPRFWRREGDGSWSRLRFGHREDLPEDEPVQHVCWYEADAFARWAGKRLPTEVEWETAASWTRGGAKRRFPWGEEEPDDTRANLASRFGPVAAGAYGRGASAWGCRQMVGDVWEWTSSDFTGYPGFEAFPYAEYSEVFFGREYKVLRGGSWATHPTAIRNTFRNWDFPVRRQTFAGFRCARDA